MKITVYESQVPLVLLTLFWALAYLFSIIHAGVYKRHAIPVFAVALNFAWEIVAGIMYFEYIDIVWLVLDMIIVALLCFEQKKSGNLKKNVFYAFCFAMYGIICLLFFNYTFDDGMTGYILLSFVMDLAMALCFVIEISNDHWANGLLLWVSVWKLLGDATAWIIYAKYLLVMILGILILTINILYVALVIRYWKANNSGWKKTDKKI